MANKDKKAANSGIKTSRRNKAIVTALVAVFALIIAGYFVYISGLLPKVMTGVKVTKTVDGVTSTVDNVSVARTNYHYYQVLNTYMGYGIISSSADIDSVYDTTTGKTYREMILDQAAEEIMNISLVNEDAAAHDYASHSGASRYATMSLASAEQTAELYGFSSLEQYLQALYGRGMSTRVYRTAVEEQTLTQEYENYVRQFYFTVSEEELDAAFEANPTVYQRVDFNYYYFPGETDEEGNYDLSAALDKAQAVADGAVDSDSFAALVIEQIGQDAADLAGFSDDYNPTKAEGYSSASAENLSVEISEFLFDDETAPGDTMTSETELGVYVVMFGDRYTNDEARVSYRTLTIYNDVYDKGDYTDESLAAGLVETVERANSIVAAPMDSRAFADSVKKNSDSLSEIITGGYSDGVAPSRFESTEDSPLSDRETTLGNWLFDSSRVHGDTLVLPSDDSSYVTIYYFEDNVPEWMYTARTQLITGMVNSWSNDLKSDNPSYAIAYDLIRKLSY